VFSNWESYPGSQIKLLQYLLSESLVDHHDAGTMKLIQQCFIRSVKTEECTRPKTLVCLSVCRQIRG